ncbi:hypothetical protein KC902_04810 [Candidatus Kaiserbacteria bacterium]|nr:hypothetical protein [Candidatus Kaiserbacteria bacterium]USN89048.1 MAG: hypothetical protein H6780_01330 [Candidatus Nomurabacteria bacterium]
MFAPTFWFQVWFFPFAWYGVASEEESLPPGVVDLRHRKAEVTHFEWHAERASVRQLKVA